MCQISPPELTISSSLLKPCRHREHTAPFIDITPPDAAIAAATAGGATSASDSLWLSRPLHMLTTTWRCHQRNSITCLSADISLTVRTLNTYSICIQLLYVQNVHHRLTYMPAVTCGGLSQRCQWLSPVTQTKLTEVHFKTQNWFWLLLQLKTPALPPNLIIQWIKVGWIRTTNH